MNISNTLIQILLLSAVSSRASSKVGDIAILEPSSKDLESDHILFPDAISCLFKDESLQLADLEGKTSLTTLPIADSTKNYLSTLDNQYSRKIYERAQDITEASKGFYAKVAEKVFAELVLDGVLTKSDNEKKNNQIRNLIEKDIKWEVKKKKVVEKMLEEKCRVVEGDSYYKLSRPELKGFRVVFQNVCSDDANFRDMEQVFSNPGFKKLHIYTRTSDFADDFFRGNVVEASKALGLTAPFYSFDKDKNLVTELTISLNVDNIFKYCAETGTPIMGALEETLRHEKDHAKYFLRNGFKSGIAAAPFLSGTHGDKTLALEIKKCVGELQKDDSVNSDHLNLILKRLKKEGTHEGLAELIGDVESPTIKKLCRSLFEFSFGHPKDLRECIDKEATRDLPSSTASQSFAKLSKDGREL